ncbi:putative nuclease HARBI1 [Galleria mellonella]|uniref:Nuclease HARBI1 n=1 Tax=Galleria mellonella TaxID=7137 RepID=A0ABM3MWQ3_GALME|nr:putative nuclease HARBI1 [Galleria mellonella]XP_052747821.1 putative nuclease HARBI1 [Galleria mellonella]XP_052748894.1 putative nuclease HARBI1 [Galleria mellonella]XP_052748895.1 putative nuclease HARBI1 [Galleria mellonella]XP_052755664.1 putative nuclease HARBI1 [Galleria mellonella]XP_052755670.1 putative nuclease HARBI1 [Galleria mellonella]
MAARLCIMIHLLEETKKEDDYKKRQQTRQLRNTRTILRDVDYIRHYRLSEDLINMLESELAPYMPVCRRSGGLSLRLKILCTLSFLGNGSYQKLIGNNLDTLISQPSASRAIHQVIDALNNINIVQKYIRFPQNSQERQALKQSFYEKFKIPGVLGCIDGTLVSMVRPHQHEERYYCRKGYHARNVMIINDADLNILHVDVTFGGATHDSFVFTNSIIKDHLEKLHNNGEVVYLLGDSGYAQRPYLMTPFNNPNPGTPEEHYNTMHSTARNSVERTIGILKGRFRCLLVHRVLHYDPTTVSKIVVACCVLHNICNRAGLSSPTLASTDLEQEKRILGTLRQAQLSQDNVATGRLCRAQVVRQLWRARHM